MARERRGNLNSVLLRHVLNNLHRYLFTFTPFGIVTAGTVQLEGERETFATG
jgi:hypothetical protein